MCCVGNDDDLRQVTLGTDGAFAGMKKGAVFVDHTTASAEIARELFKAGAERGFDCIDAPVSGGQAGAENGVLTVMCGGERRSVRARGKRSRPTRVPATSWVRRVQANSPRWSIRSVSRASYRACQKGCISQRRPGSTSTN